MWTNFIRSPAKDRAICKLCFHKQLKITSKQNAWVTLMQHVSTKFHQDNVKDFEKTPIDFPYASKEGMTFDDYATLIQKSAITEGNL